MALALAPGDHLRLTRKAWLIGTAFGFLAAVGQGGGAVLSRQAFAVSAAVGENVDGVTAAYQRILGGLAVAASGLWVARQHEKQRDVSRAGLSNSQPSSTGGGAAVLGWVLVNALSGPTLGVSCFQWALKTEPTGIVLLIVATPPLVVIPLARVMEGEPVTVRDVIGGAMAVAGVVGLGVVA